MKIFISIFLALILLLGTSKIKINIISLKTEKNSRKVKFDIKFGIFLLGLIKIVGITFKETGIFILGFHIPYPKIEIKKMNVKFIKNIPFSKILRMINLKVERFQLYLQIGTENVMFTIFLVSFIASFVSILLAQKRRKINRNYCDYEILPMYHTNGLEADISLRFSFYLMNFIKAMQLVKQTKQYHVHIQPQKTVKI